MKSFSAAVISTYNIFTAKHLLGCLLCTWLQLSTRQGFIHTTHIENTTQKGSWAAFDLPARKNPSLTRICEIHLGLQSICLQLVTGADAWSSVPGLSTAHAIHHYCRDNICTKQKLRVFVNSLVF